MSSDATAANHRGVRLQKVVLAVLQLIFIAATLAIFPGYGIKVYVITSISSAAFGACGVRNLSDVFLVFVIGFSLFLAVFAIVMGRDLLF